MSDILTFFSMMVIALFTENIIFTRSLGTSYMLYLLKNPKDLVACSGIIMAVMTSSGLLGYPFRRFAGTGEYSLVTSTIIYLAAMAVSYLIAQLVLSKFFPELHDRLRHKLGAATFNCAVLGSILIPYNDRMDLFATLGYGIGAGIGFGLAVLITGYGTETLKYKKIPKAFKGLPITLIYLGLLSLAFYGLIGHQLPS